MQPIYFSPAYMMILFIFMSQLAFIFYLKQQAILCKDSIDEKKRANKAWGYIVLATALFIVLLIILSERGFFSVPSFPPRFPLILAPHFLFMLYPISHRVANKLSFLKAIPAGLLVVVQFYRFVLEFVVLTLHRQGLLPLEITYEGRSFDLWVGISSLVVGFLLFKKVKHAERLGVVFNLFGLASLANIIFIAATSFPSPFRIFATNFLPTFFPGILIPAFIAPFAIYMHILSLKQLMHSLRYSKRPAVKASL